jgi:hypothetical protein
MTHKLAAVPETITLAVGRRARSDSLIELAAELALKGEVHVLDGGNSFSAYKAARFVRRLTTNSGEVLQRILLARAFTCYQVITLLRQTPDSPDPKMVMGLLATFCDESVSLDESRRLLEIAIGELVRFRRSSAVVVSVARPPQPERAILVDLLVGAADKVILDNAPAPVIPARLL